MAIYVQIVISAEFAVHLKSGCAESQVALEIFPMSPVMHKVTHSSLNPNLPLQSPLCPTIRVTVLRVCPRGSS